MTTVNAASAARPDKSDRQIQGDVIAELAWDDRIEETDVGVEVDGGVVTLTGTVDSYAKRQAAQEAAHRVSGVLDVANDIAVHLRGSHQRTDTEIAQAVRHALEWDVLVPDERIHSTVRDGLVTLEGTVDRYREREDAVSAVRRLRGVRGVVNDLVVAAQSIAAGQVREAIEGALERRADRAAKRIQVTVHDGTVTLTGPVRSWLERQAVLGAARFSPGVYKVEDHLYVEPEA
jgi:osmotically-inducible protein OsmY